MAEILYRVVTWGLLSIFAAFMAFGIAIAAYTLFNFYRAQFNKLAGFKATRSNK
ncbi:hypothetical protein [Maricaulis sp.]|uniref:hypothetical protein n=1 Tax=Maricaulis sp. TaxID=1486257 RepID=UPI003A92AD5B